MAESGQCGDAGRWRAAPARPPRSRRRPAPCRGDVAALRHLVPGVPQLADDRHLTAAADLVHAPGAAPGVLAGRGGRRRRDGVELLPGPLQLALLLQLLLQRVAQVDQELHVERGVAQPGLGQRAGGPVHGGVPLLQGVTEDALDHGAEADAREAREASGQLGVEERGGSHAYVPQAGEVLGGGVQDPLGAGQGGGQAGEVGAADRVDQCAARAFAAQLHEVGALAVAVAGGALGVDGHRAGARGEGRDHPGEGVVGCHHRGNALARFEQGDRRRGDVVRGSAPGGSQ
ncbi:hypothetical protein SMICM17S_03345 [Streptomyces microflavus]